MFPWITFDQSNIYVKIKNDLTFSLASWAAESIVSRVGCAVRLAAWSWPGHILHRSHHLSRLTLSRNREEPHRSRLQARRNTIGHPCRAYICQFVSQEIWIDLLAKLNRTFTSHCFQFVWLSDFQLMHRTQLISCSLTNHKWPQFVCM